MGLEDAMHVEFGQLIKQYEFYNKLKAGLWTYFPSGEKRTLSTGALLKKKGTAKGWSDYIFIKENGEILFLEFKTDKGKMSDSQILFEDNCNNIEKARYFLVRSVNEAINILKDEQIIID